MNTAQKWYVKGGAYRLNSNPEALDNQERKLAAQFIAMFDDCDPLDNEILLYRGVGNGSYANQIGQYWSTSSDDKIAESFTRERLQRDARGRWKAIKTGEVLIIRVTPGVRVMEIGGVQREFVIERGITVQETMRRQHGEMTYIWLTVSPN